MKKMLLTVLLVASVITYAAETPKVDEKVLKCFASSFPKADKITWYEESDCFLVYFTNDDVKCRMWYSKDGNVLKTIRYYSEQSLCPFMLTKIKQNFPDKTVYGITEVSTDSGVNYNIILEDEKKWYHVTIDTNGTVRLDKKYNKA